MKTRSENKGRLCQSGVGQARVGGWPGKFVNPAALCYGSNTMLDINHSFFKGLQETLAGLPAAGKGLNT